MMAAEHRLAADQLLQKIVAFENSASKPDSRISIAYLATVSGALEIQRSIHLATADILDAIGESRSGDYG